MDKGITNLEFNNFFENEEKQDIKNNYMGGYSMDQKKVIKKRNGKYLFAIFDTDRHNKPGTQWRRFMDIHPPPHPPKKKKKIYYYLIA